MFPTRLLLLALLAVAGPYELFAQRPRGGSGLVPVQVKRSVAIRKARRPISPVQTLLMRRVQRIDWDDLPFGDVLEWVRQQRTAGGKVNIVPRWRSLATQSVDKNTPVTLRLENVTVAQVLDETFDQLSNADPITYVAVGNLLRVSTRSDFRRKLVTAVYDVRELLAQMRGSRVKPQLFVGIQLDVGAFTATPGAGLGAQGQTFNIGATLFGGGGRDNDDDDGDDPQREEEDMDRIVEMIQRTVLPETWEVNGGRGTLAILDGVLVVRNSADVHALLGGDFLIGQ